MNINGIDGATHFTLEACMAIFRIAYLGFFPLIVHSQYIERADVNTNAATRAFISVNLLYHTTLLWKILLKSIAPFQ
jgi:hypothetical protein